MPSGDFWTISKRLWPIPVLVVVFVAVVAFNAGVWKWLGESTNATAIEGFAAIVQGVFTLVLIALTAFTVRANVDMARETKRMAEVAVAQQRGAIMPAMLLRLQKHTGLHGGTVHPRVDLFQLEVANVGTGPALETTITIVGPLRFSIRSEAVPPFTLVQMEPEQFWFQLDEDTPFSDPSRPLKWPRSNEDAQLQEHLEAEKKAGRSLSKDKNVRSEYDTIRSNLRKHHIRYQKDLTACIAAMPDVGYLAVTYRDLAGTWYTSMAPVVIGDRGEVEEFEDDEEDVKIGYYQPTWPPVSLGPLSVREQPTTEV